jgi:hypothetical protein
LAYGEVRQHLDVEKNASAFFDIVGMSALRSELESI